MTTAQDQQSRAPADQWKCGNEFLPYHPSASHVEPAYRDGWNACFKAAAQVLAMGRVPPGWQAVPVERTEEMKRAVMELLLDGLDIYVNGQEQIVIETDAPRRLWKAFLAAAPRTPAAQEGA